MGLPFEKPGEASVVKITLRKGQRPEIDPGTQALLDSDVWEYGDETTCTQTRPLADYDYEG